MSDEWGPWIEHDGKGCPCVGMWVQAVLIGKAGRFESGRGERLPSGGAQLTVEGIAGQEPANWDWTKFGTVLRRGVLASKVIRYRIRKPRALIELIEMVENLPAPSKPQVPA